MQDFLYSMMKLCNPLLLRIYQWPLKIQMEPQAPGTLITRTRPKNNLPISGIASTSGFASVYIQKYMMNREVGFVRRTAFCVGKIQRFF